MWHDESEAAEHVVPFTLYMVTLIVPVVPMILSINAPPCTEAGSNCVYKGNLATVSFVVALLSCKVGTALRSTVAVFTP